MSRIPNKKSLLILQMLLSLLSTQAQTPFFQHYYLLKKNEDVHINTIFQDKSGFIWYGTNKGLFRTDGINQIRYTLADSLPDNQVTAIAQDSLGNIWTGHKNGKIAYMENGSIHAFVFNEGDATAQISDMLFDKNGNLWFATLGDGLYYYTNERLFRLDEDNNMPDIYIYDINIDKSGNIWAGTDRGIAICTLPKHENKVSIKTLNNSGGLPDNIIKKIKFDVNNHAYLATEDAGIVRYNPIDGKSTILLAKNWTYGSITDFIFKDQQIWIATAQAKLIIYDTYLNKIVSYNAKNVENFTAISAMLTDNEGNIWLGLKTSILRTKGNYISHINSIEPALDQNILAITVDKQGSIWFSNSEGLYKRTINRQDSGEFIVKKQLSNTKFHNFNIISLYCDAKGYIYAGLYGDGVLRINPLNGKIQHINKELRNGSVLHITGNKNTVWLATLGGSTEIKTDKDQLVFKNYSNNEGLISDYIYQVFIDSKNRTWFATDRDGIDMLDEKGFHHFKAGLSSKVIYGFTEDSSNILYANVQGEGLYQYNGKDFITSPINSLLRNLNINILSTDMDGNLIVMHDMGIDIYNVKDKKVKYLGEEVGIKDKIPNLNAITTDMTGNTYIGTEKGIIKYAHLSQNDTALPQPKILKLKIYDKEIELTNNMDFSYDQNNVTISYHGFWYQNPNELTYQYILENYDRDWIVSRDRSAIYSSLPPGKYKFRLKTSENGLFNNAKEVQFQFEIHPPYWQQPWFYFIVAAAIISLGYAIMKGRERQLKHEKKVLEAAVLERTREIQSKNDEILAQNEEIQSQSEEIHVINENLEATVLQRTAELEKKNEALEEYAFINAHNLRAPVASILGLIYLIKNLDLSSNEGQEIIEHLHISGKKLEEIVHSITEAIERGDDL